MSHAPASPVNPAIALAIILFNSGSAENWASCWIFIGGSFAGSFLALIFFRFVYQKTAADIEQMEDEEDEDANQEALLGE